MPLARLKVLEDQMNAEAEFDMFIGEKRFAMANQIPTWRMREILEEHLEALDEKEEREAQGTPAQVRTRDESC